MTQREWMTPTGAAALAEKIKQFWLKRKYCGVRTWIEPVIRPITRLAGGILGVTALRHIAAKPHRTLAFLLIVALMASVSLYPTITSRSFEDKAARGARVQLGADWQFLFNAPDLVDVSQLQGGLHAQLAALRPGDRRGPGVLVRGDHPLPVTDLHEDVRRHVERMVRGRGHPRIGAGRPQPERRVGRIVVGVDQVVQHPGMLRIAVGLLLQALLFGHGGVTTLGVNVAVYAPPAMLCGLVCGPLRRSGLARVPAVRFVLVFLAAVVLLGTAVLVAQWLQVTLTSGQDPSEWWLTRPVVVAIVTEGPELSDRYFQQVLEPIRSSKAAFHVVTLGRPVNDSHDRGVVLDEGTRASGGRYENVLAGTAIGTRLQQIANDLMHQYKVTYARPDTLIPPEEITVSAAKPGVTARGTPVLEPPAQARP